MDNKFLIGVEKAFAYIFCALTLLYMVLLTIDLFHFNSNPSDYANVYHKDSSDKVWINDYIIQGLILIFSCFIIFGLSLWRIIKPNKTLRLIVDSLYIISIIIVSIKFYEWYLTGFDHP